MKHIIFVSAHTDQSTSRLEHQLLRETAPVLAERCLGYVVNLINVVPASHWNAIIELWLHDDTPLASLNLARFFDGIGEYACYAVSEHIEKNELTCDGQPTPAIKQIATWVRRVDMSADEARRHWDEHVPLANRVHVGCVRYVRHWVQSMATSPTTQPYQGIAFQYFLSANDLQNRMFDRPESVQLIVDDTKEFIERFEVFVCREYVIKSLRNVS